jgi:hypothetical protein
MPRRKDVAVIDIPERVHQTRVEDERKEYGVHQDSQFSRYPVVETPDVYKSYATKGQEGIRRLLVQYQNALYG